MSALTVPFLRNGIAKGLAADLADDARFDFAPKAPFVRCSTISPAKLLP